MFIFQQSLIFSVFLLSLSRHCPLLLPCFSYVCNDDHIYHSFYRPLKQQFAGEEYVHASLKVVFQIRDTAKCRSMLSVHRVVHSEFVPQGQTVDMEFCFNVFRLLRENIQYLC